MEMLRGVCVSACFLGIVFSLAEGLIPSEKYVPQMKTVFALIFILVIVSPFVKGEIDTAAFDISDPYAEDYSEAVQNELNRRINGNICDKVAQMLGAEGICPMNISIDVNNLPDGSISITKAEITLPEGSDEKTAEAVLREALGDDAEIKIISVRKEDSHAKTQTAVIEHKE